MKKRILVVDDEPDFSGVLKLQLETLGYYEVLEENEPARVIQSGRQFDPDLIILDIMMPEVDGSELAARIKSDRVLWDIPVIFLTALILGDEAPSGSCSRGGHTFLPKSIPMEKLIECIEGKIGEKNAVSAGAR